MQITGWLYRHVGSGVASVLLYPIVGYFFLTGRAARHGSIVDRRRVCATPGAACRLGAPPGLLQSFRHFLEFGGAILDRVGFWLGRRDDFELEVDGMHHLDRVAEEKCGCLILGSHLGSFDAMRLLAATRSPISVCVLMHTENAARINDLLSSASEPDENVKVRVIQVQAGSFSHALDVKACIERGEVVAVLGDRFHPNESDRVTSVEFLGAPAALPQGPLLLASALGCPVLLMVGLRVGTRRYRVHVEPFAERVRIPRKERTKALAHYCQLYADRISYFCVRNPLQWFNFYDFWGKEEASRDP